MPQHPEANLTGYLILTGSSATAASSPLRRSPIGRGVDANGKPWQTLMPATYGRIKNTKARDGDQVDIYLGQNLKAPEVFVVNQVYRATGRGGEGDHRRRLRRGSGRAV